MLETHGQFQAQLQEFQSDAIPLISLETFEWFKRKGNHSNNPCNESALYWGVFWGMCWVSWRTGTIHGLQKGGQELIVKNCKHSLRLIILQSLAIRRRLLETGASAGSSEGDWGSGTRNTAALFSFEKQDLLHRLVSDLGKTRSTWNRTS